MEQKKMKNYELFLIHRDITFELDVCERIIHR